MAIGTPSLFCSPDVCIALCISPITWKQKYVIRPASQLSGKFAMSVILVWIILCLFIYAFEKDIWVTSLPCLYLEEACTCVPHPTLPIPWVIYFSSPKQALKRNPQSGTRLQVCTCVPPSDVSDPPGVRRLLCCICSPVTHTKVIAHRSLLGHSRVIAV